jgi:soluble lytic murein transglycosylase-like protein
MVWINTTETPMTSEFFALPTFHNTGKRADLKPVVFRHLVWATLVLMLICASVGHIGGMAPDRLPRPLPPNRALAAVIDATPNRLAKSAIDKNIETLTRVVGAKYRVSPDMTRQFLGTAYREAQRNRLDPMLIVAVMAVESVFNPRAESGAGAVGLMQVIPRYHPEKFSPERGESMRDPSTNIRVGSQALKEYIVRGGTEAAGLQLYNGTSSDPSNAYAAKVTAERQRLQEALRRARDRA